MKMAVVVTTTAAIFARIVAAVDALVFHEHGLGFQLFVVVVVFQ